MLKKNSPVSIRISRELRTKIEAIAHTEFRTMTNQIEKFIEDSLTRYESSISKPKKEKYLEAIKFISSRVSQDK